MERIRIIQMIDKPFLGGGQRHLLSLAESLDSGLFEVFVSSAPGGPLEDACRNKDIPFIPAPFRGRIDFRISGILKRILAGGSFRILHTHGGIAGMYGRMAARRIPNLSVIHTIHGIHYLHYRNPVLKYLSILQERYLSRLSDALILVSSTDKDKAVKNRLAPQDLMQVVPNGIDFGSVEKRRLDPDAAARKREDLGIPSEAVVLGTVARLHRQKGLSFLLRAVPDILREVPKAVLVIAGGGPEEPGLKKLAQELDINSAVRFLGERKDALEILSIFDIFVLSSLWEGLPYVLLEAAAMGKPVAATAVDGITEIIQDKETGILAPAENSHALAEAVCRLCRDPDLADNLGQRLKDQASRNFTLTRMVSAIQDVYITLSSETGI